MTTPRPYSTLAEVNHALVPWGYRALVFEPVRGGVENRCLIVDTSDRQGGELVLRVHAPGSHDRVALELAALAQVAAAGLPVPRPLRTTGGEAFAERDGRPMSLVSHVGGVTLDRAAAAPVPGRDVGALLARVGATLLALPPAPIRHGIADVEAAKDLLARCRQIAGFPWQGVAEAVQAATVVESDWRALPRQIIHGDLSRTNVVHDGARFAFVDLGGVGAAPRVADIAVAIAQLAVVRGRFRADICAGLWAGWSAVAAPSDAEREAVLPMVRLRYAQLIVEHVWRELDGRRHPRHLPLIALGIEGLHALASLRDGLPGLHRRRLGSAA